LPASLIYRSPYLYELAMLLLYGRHYFSRQRAIADLIPPRATVLDVCCGPGSLYSRHLRDKRVEYTGIDSNARFIEEVRRRGGRGIVCDLKSSGPLPPADFVLMQASLYHFLPDPFPVLERMLEAAKQTLVIAEPVRNVAASGSRLLSFLGRRFSNAGSGAEPLRFTAGTLDEVMDRFADRIEQAFDIPGGRERVYVLNSRPAAPAV
jgi:SAM-dependent methyltransferase